jgi:hypothetical protein
MKAVAADLRGRQNMAQIYALRAFCGVLIAARVLPQDPPSRHSGRVPTDHILPYPPLNLSEPGGGGHRCSLGEKWKAAMTLLSDVAQEHTLDKRYNLTRFQEALYHLGRVFAAAPKEVSHPVIQRPGEMTGRRFALVSEHAHRSGRGLTLRGGDAGPR